MFSKVAISCSIFLYLRRSFSLSNFKPLSPFPEFFTSITILLNLLSFFSLSRDLISAKWASIASLNSFCTFSFSLNGTKPIAFHLFWNSLIAEIFLSFSSHTTYCFTSSISAIFFERFSPYFSSTSSRCLDLFSKNASHAALNLFHTISDCFLATGPICFHCFCNEINWSVAFFQSSLNMRASAF